MYGRATAIATMVKALPHSQLTGCIQLTDDGNAFPMVAMAVAMTAAMADGGGGDTAPPRHHRGGRPRRLDTSPACGISPRHRARTRSDLRLWRDTRKTADESMSR